MRLLIFGSRRITDPCEIERALLHIGFLSRIRTEGSFVITTPKKGVGSATETLMSSLGIETKLIGYRHDDSGRAIVLSNAYQTFEAAVEDCDYAVIIDRIPSRRSSIEKEEAIRARNKPFMVFEFGSVWIHLPENNYRPFNPLKWKFVFNRST